MLSIKLVPINPQKNTNEILLIKIAIKNFLNSILDNAAAMLTMNAGVKGIANSTTKLDNFILSILFINKLNLFIFLILVVKKFLKQVLIE